jgi:hypothetical protein
LGTISGHFGFLVAPESLGHLLGLSPLFITGEMEAVEIDGQDFWETPHGACNPGRSERFGEDSSL